jgi:multidrug efflux system outer membrane protein
MRTPLPVRGLLIALTVGLLAGCVVGPDYHRPSAFGTNALPATFSVDPNAALNTNQAEWKPAQPAASIARGAWWEIFSSDALNRLEESAAVDNQEIASAFARFEQARALVQVARADLLPNASLNPGFTRQRTSLNEFERNPALRASSTYTTYNLPLAASWEIDLWGRVRKGVEASRARLVAVGEDLEAARLSIQADVAVDFFTLQGLDSEYALLQQTIETYRRSLELTRNRRTNGIVSDLDVAEAETQLRGAEAELPSIELQRARLKNALAVLCGQPATTFAIAHSATNIFPVKVTASVPSELLERRPDIAAAERRMAAANAEIGIAKTAFYPRLQLHGMAGLQSIDAGTLFNWPSRLWAIGPSLELPIFTGGRNRAQLERAWSAYDETVAHYRQSILVAFQEVEDQLAAQRLLQRQSESETAALIAARRTLEIANNRYHAGLITYLEVATAQSAALTRERTLVRLESQRQTAEINLARALGGPARQ